jgi:hypothetical protein
MTDLAVSNNSAMSTPETALEAFADALVLSLVARRERLLEQLAVLEELANRDPALARWRRAALRTRLAELHTIARELGIVLPVVELSAPSFALVIDRHGSTHVAGTVDGVPAFLCLCGKPSRGCEPAVTAGSPRELARHLTCGTCREELARPAGREVHHG